MNPEDKDHDGAALNMAIIAAAKKRLAWMRRNWPNAAKTKSWRIVMDFDEDGELLKYRESSLNRTGKELIGGGICRDTKPLRLSDVQIDVLLLGVENKLDRSSMGWSYDDRVHWSDPVRIYSPATIKALWTRGLLVGNFNGLGDIFGGKNLDGARNEYSPEKLKFQVWTSPLGKELLREIGLIPGATQVLH